MKKPKHMLTGVNIAHYRLEPDELIDVAKRFKFGKENGGVTDCGYTAVTCWAVVTCSLLVKIRVISLRHFYAILVWSNIEKYEIMIW